MGLDVERTDVLGAPYVARTIALADDFEGRVVATLVSRPAAEPTGRAVLSVHGFADYFFQTAAADFWVANGYDFHAIDLRKFGRSLLPHQTPNYVADLAEYYEGLDAALAIVTEGHDSVVVSGHSTGGLIVPLWLADRRHQVAGVVLNAPWLDMPGNLLLRSLGTGLVDRLGAQFPLRVVPRPVNGFYGRSLHADYEGEWEFNLAWKPLRSWPIHLGWLRAVRRAHARIRRGLDLTVPVLVLTSAESGRPTSMTDPSVHSTDIVLDVEQIRSRAPMLSTHVTLAKIEGAIHDVTLSRKSVREAVFDVLGRWLRAYVEGP